MRNAIRIMAILALSASAALAVERSPNGIAMPPEYRNWRIVSIDQQTDNHTLRAIVANDIGIEAARAGQTQPWPEGAILGKLVWKNAIHPKWAAATIAGDFVNADFMVKDSTRFAGTGGWGFARWLGTELKPYGNDAAIANECFGCHGIVRDSDWVFTRPATMP